MRGINIKFIQPLDKADLGHPGPAPQLDWIAVGKLRFDDSYQRKVTAQGVKHLRQIARAFDWRLFAPVIVAPIEGGDFAVIDGQHRTHAAVLRCIEKVPCQIVLADRKMQARAFAGMNGNQAIRLAPYQVHRAALAAGDIKAMAVHIVCERAGVTITTNIQADKMERGDTVAVATIYRMVAVHGAPVAIAALKAIVKTADGHVGMVNALAITGYCALFARRPDLMDVDDLLDRLDDFDLGAAMVRAWKASGKSAERRDRLVAEIEGFLDHGPEHTATQSADPQPETIFDGSHYREVTP